MRTDSPSARLFAVVSLLCAAGWRLEATPIYSGTIAVTGGGSPTGSFSFAGAGFAANGAFDMGNWAAAADCLPCAPGTLLEVAGVVLGNDFRTGSATIGGDVFPSVIWGNLNAAGPSVFQVSGPPVTVSGPGVLSGPFSFTGSLCGTLSSGGIPAPCVASLPSLTGSGIVQLAIAAQPGGLLAFSSATYTFTPEPNFTVVVLSALGLGALLRHRIRA